MPKETVFLIYYVESSNKKNNGQWFESTLDKTCVINISRNI